jgi:hypothetical protein
LTEQWHVERFYPAGDSKEKPEEELRLTGA